MTQHSQTGSLVLHSRVVSGAGGGPDKTILNSPRFLKSQGYPMLCAYLRHPADEHFCQLESRAAQWQAHLVGVDDLGPFDWGVVRRMTQLCAQHKPAIWHGHDYKTNLLGLLVRRRIPMKLITTVHGWVKRTWKTPLYYAIDRRSLRHYDHVICVSQDLYDECLGLGVEPSRCWHVPNAIDTLEFSRKVSTAVAKKAQGVSCDLHVIGAVGRLSPEKGFDNLIRAVSTLHDKGLKLELWIVGEGSAEEELRALAAQLGVQHLVKFHGFRSDTIDLYQAMDVFALSSLREGLPNVLLEAMALEVPIVTTRVAGIPSLIRDDENGLVVEPGSVSQLTEGLEALISDPNKRQQLARQGRVTVEERFSFARRMAKIKEIYDLAMDT